MRYRLGFVLPFVIVLGGCASRKESLAGARLDEGRAPPRPEACTAVSVGADLQSVLDSASGTQAFCLEDGEWKGPIGIRDGMTVWGSRAAVIRSDGKGTTVTLEGKAPRLLGVTVDGSGGRFDTLDAAVRVRGEEAVVEGVRIVNATFGILAEKSQRVVIRNNVVEGNPRKALGMRGDGIRLWETRDSVLEGNRVENSRDMVIWYSRHNRLHNNYVTGGRYGAHFMYSHDNVVEGNEYIANEVGVFVMYSRGVVLRDNLMAHASGAAGIGVGIKESGNVKVTDNDFVHNTIGAYVDSSPIQIDEHNVFERNVFRLGEAGVVFHSSLSRNTFKENSFRDNYSQVRVEGGGDALGIVWENNDFDDYAGYDLDGDGMGDIPYELRSLSSELVSRYPDLAFFRGSLSLGLVSAAGEVVPLLAPKVLVRDPNPRVAKLNWEDDRANRASRHP